MKGSKMPKILLVTVVALSGCSYQPIIDTGGRSGTYPENKAAEITNDVQHCKQLADEHTVTSIDQVQTAMNWYVSTATLGMIPRKESTYKKRVRRCLEGRGHSVID
tara:strand:- start:73 stop:390 length:318 start_codon:yes stop_codon:yes gene_type:complete